MDNGSENDMKVAAMLQLQCQEVVTMSEQHFNPSLDKLQKQLRTRTTLLQ